MKNIPAERSVEDASDGLLDKLRTAHKLRVSPRTLNEYMKRGWIPYIRLGTTVRFRWEDVLATLNERHRVN